jgi:dipeptidyl aminopeptidase/acylaminoacyl peptidase
LLEATRQEKKRRFGAAFFCAMIGGRRSSLDFAGIITITLSPGTNEALPMQLNAISRLLALPLALAAGSTFAAKPIPIESFGNQPAISSVSMGADGKQLVAIVAKPGSNYQETALATWDLDNMDKGPVLTPSGEHMKFIAATALKAGKIQVIARQEWSGSLAGCGEGKVVGTTDTFVVKAYMTDGKHSKFDEAYTDGSSRRLGVSDQTQNCLNLNVTARLVNSLPLEPTKVLISRVTGMELQSNYYIYDLKNGKTELVLRSSLETQPDLFHPRDGKLLVRSDLDQVGDTYEQYLFILNESTGEFERHDALTTVLNDRYSMDIVGFDDASGKYYVLTDKFSDYVQAWMYDPKTRKFDDEVLVAHPNFSIAALGFGNQSSNFNQLLSFTVQGPTFETTFVEPNLRAIHEGLKQAYPGKIVRITDYNDGLSRVLFTTANAQNPTSYYLLEDRKKVVALGNERPWVDNESIGEQRWVTYTARDGLKIPAILDLPVGWTEGDAPVPAVIHPHGGPWARDYTGYDGSGMVPFLTSRGFAVLRPQYRGSDGLGRKLWLAGDMEWGQKMQDDKDDGAQWLVEQGIANPEQLVMFGYSYGGFASAAAVVRPNSPYACAISGAPVTDLTRLGNLWGTSRLQRYVQGDTVDGMDPMKNTDKANIPVLLFVGSRDVRTPSWHAENFYKAVKDRVPARYELIPDMPHSLPWYPRHYESMFGLMEDFLRKECGITSA